MSLRNDILLTGAEYMFGRHTLAPLNAVWFSTDTVVIHKEIKKSYLLHRRMRTRYGSRLLQIPKAVHRIPRNDEETTKRAKKKFVNTSSSSGCYSFF